MKDLGLAATADQFDALLDCVAAADRLAFDTEFVPEYTYAPELCLIQVATPDAIGAIDTQAGFDLTPFWEFVADPRRQVVVHAGKEEMNFCKAAVGRTPPGLFDVQLAAGLVGHGYPLSLDNLLQKLVPGQKLDKGETRTDWRRRPLSQRQVDYALDDVRHLLAMADALTADLARRGHTAWLADETARFRDGIDRPTQAPWNRVAGAGNLHGPALAALAELAEWRDARARKINKPLRWLVRDDLLVELAKRQPRTLADLQALRGSGNLAQNGLGKECLDAIARGRALPPEQWPDRGPRGGASEDTMALKLLAAALIHCAREHDLAAGLLGSNEDLREMLDVLVGGDEPATPPRLLHGWRGEMCGEFFRRLVSGEVALRLESKHGRLSMVFDEGRKPAKR